MNAPVNPALLAAIGCRAALTYHPGIGTFRGQRGAWRVHHMTQFTEGQPPRICRVALEPDDVEIPMLYMDVPRPYRTGTFVNPTKLLREVLATRRYYADHPLPDFSTTKE